MKDFPGYTKADVAEVNIVVQKYNKVEFLVFVNDVYKGMIRKFPNTKTEKHPFTAMNATNGAGSFHDLAGHFNTKDEAALAIANA